jgi:UDP-N-acetylmuramyl tripeptide synthase
MFVLNDRIADGRDVSWIWDADFELTAGRFEKAVASGTRAEEMALRLKYAGWEADRIVVEPDIRRALDLSLAETPAGERLPIVPTYTAMLEVREILARRARRKPFWRE